MTRGWRRTPLSVVLLAFMASSLLLVILGLARGVPFHVGTGVINLVFWAIVWLLVDRRSRSTSV